MKKNGFALIAVITLLVVLAALVLSYGIISSVEVNSSSANTRSTQGYFAAEGGANLRARLIRDKFVGYSRPSAPTGYTLPVSGATVCPNSGSYTALPTVSASITNSLACYTSSISGRTVYTWVRENPLGLPTTTPYSLSTYPQLNPSIASGDYKGLAGEQYTFDVFSRAEARSKVEAILQYRIQSTLVPIFQFGAFYQGDLEVAPGSAYDMLGKIHTNGTFYATNGGGNFSIGDRISFANSFRFGRKAGDGGTTCNNGVRLATGLSGTTYTWTTLGGSATCPGSTEYTSTGYAGYLATSPGFIRKTDNLVLPASSSVLPSPAPATATEPKNEFWGLADARFVLDLTGGTPTISYVTPDNTTPISVPCSSITDTTQPLSYTSGSAATIPAASISNGSFKPMGFYNVRENGYRILFEVDVEGLLTCLQNNQAVIGGKSISDLTENGLVLFFTVRANNAGNGLVSSDTACTTPAALANQSQCQINPYGVRFRNGDNLRQSFGTIPATIKGLTLVTDQAFYTWGNMNLDSTTTANDRKPMAIIGDTPNILSVNWRDAKVSTTSPAYTSPCVSGSSNVLCSNPSFAIGALQFLATDTTVNAAFLSNVDDTVSTNLCATPNSGSNQNSFRGYNGGLQNNFRLHEDWGSTTLRYKGSIVSVNRPRHSSGGFCQTRFQLPLNRAFEFDQKFAGNVDLLPPLSPRFVAMELQLFARDFTQ